MVRRFLFFTAMCMLALLLTSAIAPAVRAEIEDTDAIVDRIFRNGKATGASMVIMKDGKFVYARDYGMRNVREKLPVDESTYFRIASVTKMVSSIVLLQLVEEGLLDLDRDISEYYNYPIVNPYFPKVPLTLRQLMSHTSSLSESGGFSKLSSTVSQMLNRDSGRKNNFHKVKPGSVFEYSNFGAGLTGSIAEAVSGMSFNRLITQRLFLKLDIDASFDASALAVPDEIASIYSNGKLSRSSQKYLNETYEETASPDTHYRTTVGGLFIRSRDLARLAAALCGNGTVDGMRLLDRKTLEIMRAPQYTLGRSVSGESPYGLFLERNTQALPGHVIYGHQGMNNGASTNVYFEPETGFVFVMTTNGCSMTRDHGVVVLAQNLLRATYPLFSGD